MMKKFRIYPNSSLELLLSDVVRYLVTVFHPSISKVSKIRVITWILMYSKNEVARSFIKQSLLLDWLYYLK